MIVVLYLVLSDILDDRCVARRTQVRWKGCFTFTYFYWDFPGLLQVGLFLVAVHVIFPFGFAFGKEQGISSKKVTKVQKDFIHTGRQRKNATEDESNRPHMLQASLHKHRTAGKTKNQVKKY